MVADFRGYGSCLNHGWVLPADSIRPNNDQHNILPRLKGGGRGYRVQAYARVEGLPMIWDWLGNKRIELSKTWTFSWPDASRDKCKKCAVERRFHGSDHEFKEE